MNSRNWCFTWNNPTNQNIFLSQTQVKFMVATLEYGSENNTPHYQGYIELKTSRTLNQTKAIFSCNSVHLERRMGTRADAIRYVLKTFHSELLSSTRSLDASMNLESIFISPTLDTPTLLLPDLLVLGFSGKLSDLAQLALAKTSVKKRLDRAKALIEAGASDKQLAEDDFELWIKYGRQFSKYALICSVPRNHKTLLTVIQGPTGSGKSHYCRGRYPDAYWKPRSTWWDGYTGQKAVIIDEYYGWLPYDLLLRLGDSYPLSVEVKGGNVNFNSQHILITTNKHPSNWYANVYFDAFIRRVEEWVIIKEREDVVIYDNYFNTPFINI
nr:Rep [Kummerowia striata CRESS virus]